MLPTLNEEKGIGKTIDSIKKDHFKKKKWSLEIIIVDGDSKDKTQQIAKRKGGNKVHFYTSADNEKRESLTFDIGWAQRIKLALKEDRFVLAYQPILDVNKSNKNRYEVLLRMLDESGNIIMPAGFLDPAERFKLIQEIDKWVVENAIKILVEFRKSNPENRSLNIG